MGAQHTLGPWSRAFNRKIAQGHDASSAAAIADSVERRVAKACPSTHCSRREECASPRDCSATKATVLALSTEEGK